LPPGGRRVCGNGGGDRSLLSPVVADTSGPKPRSDLPPPGGQLQSKAMSPEPAPPAGRFVCGRVIACAAAAAAAAAAAGEEQPLPKRPPKKKKKKKKGREIFHHPPFPLPPPAPAALCIRSPARGPSLRRGWGTQRRPRREAGGPQPPGLRRHPRSFLLFLLLLLLPLRRPPAPARLSAGEREGGGGGGGGGQLRGRGRG
ncbi:unnamed protein product, partial [Bubo scandiacus]